MTRLSNKSIQDLPKNVNKPSPEEKDELSHILHIGIGGFHRSHQAYAWHNLRQKYPDKYGNWTITGIGLMPSDRKLIQSLKEQDYLYTLRMCASDGNETIQIINSIKEILFGEDDSSLILERIAGKETKIISFTITEGGYNMDYENHKFMLLNADILHDLSPQNNPITVFGYLARGLSRRRASEGGKMILMSCDNIPKNGEILRFALLSFLTEYDKELKRWVEDNVYFPNSMVDRITPVTREIDKQDFEKRYGVRDEALVVSEDYFQWVLEDNKLMRIPSLDEIGVELVKDVHPYESMKLGLLNAGHSLVGFFGNMLGYTKIHEAVRDPQISLLFDQYAKNEAIPMLQSVDQVDFIHYHNMVKVRFSNHMINDSTERIISGSSDKIPKFLLPIIGKQLHQKNPRIEVSALIIVAWWYYLKKSYQTDEMKHVADNRKDQLAEIFKDEAVSAHRFLDFKPLFGELGANAIFREKYLNYINGLAKKEIREMFNHIIT